MEYKDFAKQTETPPPMILIDRMQQALIGARTAIPTGLSVEEIRAFILSIMEPGTFRKHFPKLLIK